MYQIAVSNRRKSGFSLETKTRNGGGTVSVLYSLKGGCSILDYKTSRFELRLTTREKEILKRKAKKVGLTVSDFVRSSLIHSDNLTVTVIDTSVLSKTLFELHKHGVNLNQLMKFCNTYGLDAFNESHVIPTLDNERNIFAETQAALASIAEEARRGNVVINFELSDDMEEEDSE